MRGYKIKIQNDNKGTKEERNMKRKNLMWRMLALMLIFTLVVGLASASADTSADVCPESSDGQHSWVLYRVEPKCTENGMQEWQCEKCYAYRDTETLPATGHQWVEDGKAPTCTESGYACMKCSVCGATERYTEYSALGHDWDDGVVTTEPTCVAEGVKTFTCSRCGETYTESIPATGVHTPEVIPAVAATCTAGGKTEGSKCSVCGEILTAQTDTPALGHTPEVIPAVEATCTAGGKTEGSKCSVCGEILTAQTDTPALGHTPVAIPAVAATCTSGGKTEGSKCSVCGEILTAQTDIPATGHTPEVIPGVPAGCETAGKTEGSRCSVCGAILTAQTDIPATGHNWGEWVVDVPPNCEQGSLEYLTCLNCGEQQWRNGEALGHDWDEGVVTKEAGYLEEGEIVYTCKRDPSHTKTETIPVQEPPEGKSVMSLFRNMPGVNATDISVMNLDAPLLIVTHPEDTLVPYETKESITLHVEAAGGTPSYTYEWRRKNALGYLSGGKDLTSVTEVLVTQFAGIIQQKNGKAQKCVEVIIGAHPDWNKVETYHIMEELKSDDVMIDTAFSTVVGTEQTLTTNEPGTYFCIVTDAAGVQRKSNEAFVDYSLHVAQQSHNVNIYGKDSVMLSCTAAGGNPIGDDPVNGYLYLWDGSGIVDYGAKDHGIIEVTKPGEFYCLIDDQVSSITTETVTVYSAEPLQFVSGTTDRYCRNGDGLTLWAQFSGGVPPYSVVWTHNGEELETLRAGDHPEMYPSYDEDVYLTEVIFDSPDHDYYQYGSEDECYDCVVTDAMGEVFVHTARLHYRQLEITKQPEGGILPESGGFTLTVEVNEGTDSGPFLYTLYLDDEPIDATPYGGEFLVGGPGEYWIHIENDEGAWADSDKVIVEDYEFWLDRIDTAGDIMDPEGTSSLTAVLRSETKDVTYRWTWRLHSWEMEQELTETGPECVAERPGVYRCYATNSYGEVAFMDATIHYNGDAPFIIEQPAGIQLAFDKADQKYKGETSIRVIGAGDNDDDMEYEWQTRRANESFGNSFWANDWADNSNGRILKVGCKDPDLLTVNITRCKITDKRTGGVSYSKEFRIFTAIELRIMYDSDIDQLHYRIEGGVPPYKVVMYSGDYKMSQAYASGQNNPIRSHKGWYRGHDSWSPGDYSLGFMECGAFKYVDQYYNAQEGKYKSYEPVYWIVVTDNEGNTYDSGLFTHTDFP